MTGAASGLGAAVAARLVANPDVGKVVGLDDHRGQTEGVTWRVLDIRDPSLATRLGKVDTVVHLAVDGPPTSAATGVQGELNVRGTQTVLTAAAATGVRRVVLCTSAMVYGALADNPLPLPEDAPLRAVPDGGLLSDWLEVERLAGQAPRSHPGLQVTVRPARDRGRPRHRQPAHPALRGAAAAGGARLDAALAVLPRRRPRRRRSSSRRWGR